MGEYYEVYKVGPMARNFDYHNTEADWNRFTGYLERNKIDLVQPGSVLTACRATFYGPKEALEKMIWDWFSEGQYHWYPSRPMDFSNKAFRDCIKMIKRA